MDALTNVVAVLILVLILVQVDVNQKKDKFMEELKPATAEDILAATNNLEELSKKKLSVKKLLTDKPPTAADMEAERRQLALLEKDTLESKAVLAKLSELKKVKEEVRKQRDSEQEKTTKVQAEIAKLEALLDDNPIAKIAATEVSIPISREIPKSAKIYRAIVINDRVHFIDPFTPEEQFLNEFKRHKRKWLHERIKRQGVDRYIHDQTKIAKHFKDFEFGSSRLQKIRLYISKSLTRIRIIITPDLKKGGTALAEINDQDSTYAKILKKLSRNSRAVILFYVHPNSFNTYLQARKMADEARISAGWQISHIKEYTLMVKDVEVKRLVIPPPAKPRPPGPPPIGPKLD